MNEIKFKDNGNNISTEIDCEPRFAAQCIEILLDEFLSNVENDYEGIEALFTRMLDKYRNPKSRKLD